ncbi:MAG: magnesium transporter, partial [Pseudomonadota bacterium]
MPDTPDLLDREDTLEPANDVNPIVIALDLSSDAEMRVRLEALHPADFSDYLEQLSDPQREELVARAPELITGELLAELEDEVVEDVLPLLDPSLIADALT